MLHISKILVANYSPADPAECHQCFHACAVQQVRVGTILAVSHRVSDGTCTGHEEQPGQGNPDSMSGNRSEGTALSSQKEGKVRDREGKRPPPNKEQESDRSGNGCRLRVVLLVKVGHQRRSNDGDYKREEGQGSEDNRVSVPWRSRSAFHSALYYSQSRRLYSPSSDVGRCVNHCE
jgi:hypothetical protein